MIKRGNLESQTWLPVLSVIHELFPFDLLCIIHVCLPSMYFYKYSIHRCLAVVSEN